MLTSPSIYEGNLSSKSDVGSYTYAPAHSHAVTQTGANSYGYDQNGNMTSCTVGGVVWTYSYNAENQLLTIKKNNQMVSEYGYDGDGQRVWAKDYEGYLATNPKVTTYIGNHYEVRVEGYLQSAGGGTGQPCSAPSYCTYLPIVANSHIENISYYYADGQRIAMKNNGVVSYLYGDQLGSTSAVADMNGSLGSKTLYHPGEQPEIHKGQTQPTMLIPDTLKSTSWLSPTIPTWRGIRSSTRLQLSPFFPIGFPSLASDATLYLHYALPSPTLYLVLTLPYKRL
ncbi:MAG: hypothetical protein WBI14_08595 [Anaerolineaceae bacterium]